MPYKIKPEVWIDEATADWDGGRAYAVLYDLYNKDYMAHNMLGSTELLPLNWCMINIGERE